MTTIEVASPRRWPSVLLLALLVGAGGLALGLRTSAERPRAQAVPAEVKLFVPQALPAETLPWDSPASVGRAPPGREAPASQARHAPIH